MTVTELPEWARAGLIAAAHLPTHREVEALRAERDELRDERGVWRSAFWIVSVQFLIMFIAALAGWLR